MEPKLIGDGGAYGMDKGCRQPIHMPGLRAHHLWWARLLCAGSAQGASKDHIDSNSLAYLTNRGLSAFSRTRSGHWLVLTE